MPPRLPPILLAAALFFLPPFSARAQSITLLANGDVTGWEYQTFKEIDETAYAASEEGEGGATVLAAESRAAASGYTLRRTLSLDDTPWLHFRWRVREAGANTAEKTRDGDDFAWRLYFVGRSGVVYRAISLVYAQHAGEGERWKSPYANFFSDVHLVAAAAHDEAKLGEWQTTSINIGALWREVFDEEGEVGLVGFMTDGDNAGVVMRADYGEVILSAKERP